MPDRRAEHCDRHAQPVRMLPQVINRTLHQASGGMDAMRGTGQTVWTCPTCKAQKVTSP